MLTEEEIKKVYEKVCETVNQSYMISKPNLVFYNFDSCIAAKYINSSFGIKKYPKDVICVNLHTNGDERYFEMLLKHEIAHHINFVLFKGKNHDTTFWKILYSLNYDFTSECYKVPNHILKLLKSD